MNKYYILDIDNYNSNVTIQEIFLDQKDIEKKAGNLYFKNDRVFKEYEKAKEAKEKYQLWIDCN